MKKLPKISMKLCVVLVLTINISSTYVNSILLHHLMIFTIFLGSINHLIRWFTFILCQTMIRKIKIIISLASISLRTIFAIIFLSSSWLLLSPIRPRAESLTSMMYSLSSLSTTASTDQTARPPNMSET